MRATCLAHFILDGLSQETESWNKPTVDFRPPICPKEASFQFGTLAIKHVKARVLHEAKCTVPYIGLAVVFRNVRIIVDG
jgi:hypothetical protein